MHLNLISIKKTKKNSKGWPVRWKAINYVKSLNWINWIDNSFALLDSDLLKKQRKKVFN